MRKSYQVALGGVVASLCVILMLLTGFFPFLTYASPIAACFLLAVIVIECGSSWAMLVYLTVALISIFLVPDKQAAILFAFLGYYPILKEYLDGKMKSKLVRGTIQFVCFNLSVILAYALMLYVFKLPDIMTEMGSLGKYTGIVTLAAGNVLFIMFDVALTRIVSVYKNHFRSKVLRKLK